MEFSVKFLDITALILGKLFGNTSIWIIGSIIPDIDHIYVAIKYNLWNSKRFIDSLKHEKKYNIHYKTPLIHSISGLIISSIVFYLIKPKLIYTFSIAYLLHLLMDWPDQDKKQFLYPLKMNFKGLLPIWSKTEKIITLISLIILIMIQFLF